MSSPHKALTEEPQNHKHEEVRTFGNLKNESPMQNGDALDDKSVTKMDEDNTEENSKFTREMKLLGHQDLKTPKSVKRKFIKLQSKNEYSIIVFL